MVQFQPFSLNLHGRLFECKRPQVMGIVNVTSDSFFGHSRCSDSESIETRVKQMIEDGADMIDIGACSSRPGAAIVDESIEIERIAMGVKSIRNVSDTIPVSVDTFRSSVAKAAVSEGADIINDISGGNLDDKMFETVAELKTPYILMHMRGTPSNMQSLCDYEDVTTDVIYELSIKLSALEELGVSDVIVDPGFGFSKTPEQNYRLLHNLPQIREILQRHLLVGISRKSMLTKPLKITPEEALEATTACNTLALTNGASILRVHDVKAACQAASIVDMMINPHNVNHLL